MCSYLHSELPYFRKSGHSAEKDCEVRWPNIRDRLGGLTENSSGSQKTPTKRWAANHTDKARQLEPECMWDRRVRVFEKGGAAAAPGHHEREQLTSSHLTAAQQLSEGDWSEWPARPHCWLERAGHRPLSPMPTGTGEVQTGEILSQTQWFPPQRSLSWWLMGMLFLSQMETIFEQRWLACNGAHGLSQKWVWPAQPWECPHKG